MLEVFQVQTHTSVHTIFLIALLVSGCEPTGVIKSDSETDNDWDLYAIHHDVMDILLPLPIAPYNTIGFRRYDSYARLSNQPEFAGSLDIGYRDGDRIIKAVYRQLVNDNLYRQLIQAEHKTAGKYPGAKSISRMVNWREFVTDSDDCKEIINSWNTASSINLNSDFILSKVFNDDGSRVSEYGEITIRMHGPIYEIYYEGDDRTIFITTRNSDDAITRWIDEAIEGLRNCEIRTSNQSKKSQPSAAGTH